jgi:hypothetical protein
MRRRAILLPPKLAMAALDDEPANGLTGQGCSSLKTVIASQRFSAKRAMTGSAAI